MRVFALALALLLLLAAPAGAATVSMSEGTLRVSAAPGETNALTVGALGVEDSAGTPLTVGTAGCASGSAAAGSSRSPARAAPASTGACCRTCST
jgi:hypothetical protein